MLRGHDLGGEFAHFLAPTGGELVGGHVALVEGFYVGARFFEVLDKDGFLALGEDCRANVTGKEDAGSLVEEVELPAGMEEVSRDETQDCP